MNHWLRWIFINKYITVIFWYANSPTDKSAVVVCVMNVVFFQFFLFFLCCIYRFMTKSNRKPWGPLTIPLNLSKTTFLCLIFSLFKSTWKRSLNKRHCFKSWPRNSGGKCLTWRQQIYFYIHLHTFALAQSKAISTTAIYTFFWQHLIDCIWMRKKAKKKCSAEKVIVSDNNSFD